MTAPLDAELVTLRAASRALTPPRANNYFTVLQRRWVGHHAVPFPEPDAHVLGRDAWRLGTLTAWDAKRKAYVHLQRVAENKSRAKAPVEP